MILCVRLVSGGSSPLARGTLRARRVVAVLVRLIPARAGNTGRRTASVVNGAAHPRSRGEHYREGGLFVIAHGSSPLARGTLHHALSRRINLRLIPARAGNTLPTFRLFDLSAAHPRSRGEHAITIPSRCAASGSSPLARGTLRVIAHEFGDLRLIPARAGNTREAQNTPWRQSAHPRSRGEHILDKCQALANFGSSPLARGTPAS